MEPRIDRGRGRGHDDRLVGPLNAPPQAALVEEERELLPAVAPGDEHLRVAKVVEFDPGRHGELLELGEIGVDEGGLADAIEGDLAAGG